MPASPGYARIYAGRAGDGSVYRVVPEPGYRMISARRGADILVARAARIVEIIT